LQEIKHNQNKIMARRFQLLNLKKKKHTAKAAVDVYANANRTPSSIWAQFLSEPFEGRIERRGKIVNPKSEYRREPVLD